MCADPHRRLDVELEPEIYPLYLLGFLDVRINANLLSTTERALAFALGLEHYGGELLLRKHLELALASFLSADEKAPKPGT